MKALKSVVLGGGKVLDAEVQNLIELFMTQAIKLEKIVADGDVKQERRSQVYFSEFNQSSLLTIFIQTPHSSNSCSIEWSITLFISLFLVSPHFEGEEGAEIC